MEKRQKLKYIICDTLSAMLAWVALFVFRKVVLEQTGFVDVGGVFHDRNLWLGMVIVPV